MDTEIFNIIGRQHNILASDVTELEHELSALVEQSNFLIIGGAGSIGKAVAIEIFKRNPKKLHVVDINENNIVELVRTLRSSIGYQGGEFKTFCIDCGNNLFDYFYQMEGPYDYVLNLSALKHVRSEKDIFTLMRMIETNIHNALKIQNLAARYDAKNYFCVSTDKATNPVNMMGASKRIMEKLLFKESINQHVSMARFANVAFSDGSLLHGFTQRIINKQPITAPSDISRYFIVPEEAGALCLITTLLGDNRDIIFPKITSEIDLVSFKEIATNYIRYCGFEPFICSSEEQARQDVSKLIASKKWPVYFFESDTTGEKQYEEFHTEDEALNLNTFINLGVIKNIVPEDDKLTCFLGRIQEFMERGSWNKDELVKIFCEVLPNFEHIETGRNLDNKM